MLSRAEDQALAAFLAWLRAGFGTRVRDVRLFGSRARGEGSQDSDLDVLVVIDELTGDEARAVGQQAGDALTDHDVILAPLVVSSDHWRRLVAHERRIAREIERDGVPV